ncbi:MAG: WcaF family extracellular polysaccharide biosynthesis acetyltransferase [Sphingomonas sp.]
MAGLPVPDLGAYVPTGFARGRPAAVEALWLLVQALFVSSWLPGSWHRRLLLRAFGARIGRKVVLKPGVRVKFPWRLAIGDNSWIGEAAWIDNLAEVRIGADCCVSQGAYLCTGSHDWSAPGFDLMTRPIALEPGAWIGARASVGPGVTVGRGAVLALGSVATRDLNPWTLYRGVPAEAAGERSIAAPPRNKGR